MHPLHSPVFKQKIFSGHVCDNVMLMLYSEHMCLSEIYIFKPVTYIERTLIHLKFVVVSQPIS